MLDGNWIRVIDKAPENGKRYIVLDIRGKEVVATCNRNLGTWVLDKGYLYAWEVTVYKEIDS
jgi:hypothetical protein